MLQSTVERLPSLNSLTEALELVMPTPTGEPTAAALPASPPSGMRRRGFARVDSSNTRSEALLQATLSSAPALKGPHVLYMDLSVNSIGWNGLCGLALAMEKRRAKKLPPVAIDLDANSIFAEVSDDFLFDEHAIHH